MDDTTKETTPSPYAGHSPGPWVNEDGRIFDAEERLVCDVGPDGIALDEEDAANAALIADAPTILAERDTLRAKLEARKNFIAPGDAARADEKSKSQRDALRAENARLRAALITYQEAGQVVGKHFNNVKKHFTEMNYLAQAAKAAHAALKKQD